MTRLSLTYLTLTYTYMLHKCSKRPVACSMPMVKTCMNIFTAQSHQATCLFCTGLSFFSPQTACFHPQGQLGGRLEQHWDKKHNTVMSIYRCSLYHIQLEKVSRRKELIIPFHNQTLLSVMSEWHAGNPWACPHLTSNNKWRWLIQLTVERIFTVKPSDQRRLTFREERCCHSGDATSATFRSSAMQQSRFCPLVSHEAQRCWFMSRI